MSVNILGSAKMVKTGKARTTSQRLEPAKTINHCATESRLDPLTGNWTIFAPHREGRPEEFLDPQDCVNSRVQCPFCPGNERTTPPPVWVGRISDDDSSTDILSESNVLTANKDWSVRVVPNKFPAVGPVETRNSHERGSALFQRGPIRGAHEVVIESRQHVQSLSDLDVAEISLVFQAYRDRLQYWREIPGVSYLSTFKNVGGKAGASLRHTHSQLIATDKMPPAVSASIERMNRHRADSGCCLQCDLIRAEVKAKQRMVWRDDSLVAFCPFASHLPMLIRLTTLEHQACYEDLDEETIESVSRAVSRIVSWLEKLRPGTAYNFCLHTRPPGTSGSHDSYHWSIEIFPRMTQVAGFEWSSQCMINPVLPEVAASKYRGCARAEDPRMIL
jgi:UDPglucose--hexose-1-phosphate uridylyltransferase